MRLSCYIYILYCVCICIFIPSSFESATEMVLVTKGAYECIYLFIYNMYTYMYVSVDDTYNSHIILSTQFILALTLQLVCIYIYIYISIKFNISCFVLGCLVGERTCSPAVDICGTCGTFLELPLLPHDLFSPFAGGKVSI